MPILHWLYRANTLATTPRVPCRILRAHDTLFYGDKDSSNLLIQGDNQHALKALLRYLKNFDKRQNHETIAQIQGREIKRNSISEKTYP